ncbi:protein kinase [Litorivicinus lipolyticus]|uniref:Protein kinase n=1 Tax=Litorivicinus lipolyticus TaxID=418701 RepID=A0A5Q2QFE5_9GAMM|nr:protein kinase [Litorivicinus lipolyticus]QGG80560.1 protein kinase [Litorivicinus lipolyticus]
MRLLGRGNHGEVWLAHDRALKRWVAIKSGLALEHEARDYPRCSAVVVLHDRLDDGRLVFEYCAWPTLAAALTRHWSATQCEQACLSAWRGLASLLASGWAHGDLAPDNLLVSPRGAIRFIDLGSRVRLGQPARHTRRDYSAPEVQAGGAVTEAAEVYAMAAVLMRLVRRTAGTTRLRRQLNRCLDPSPRARPSLVQLTRPLARPSPGARAARLSLLIVGLVTAATLSHVPAPADEFERLSQDAAATRLPGAPVRLVPVPTTR